MPAVIAFFCHRRRKLGLKRRPPSTHGNAEVSQQEQRPSAVQEKDGTAVIGELFTTANTHEMDGRQKSKKGPPVELPGS